MSTSILAKRVPALPEDLRSGTKAYDLFAAIPLVIWYGLGAVSQFRVLRAELAQLDLANLHFALVMAILAKLALFMFAIVVIGLLFARRVPKAGATGILPRVMAVLGTYLGIGLLLLPKPEMTPALLLLSTCFILAGMAFAVYSLTWLGRSLSLMPEARKLVTGGPYAIVRHPLYLGEEIASIGVVIQFFSGWALLLMAMQFCCQLYRMYCEEKVLEKTFPDYAAYKARTYRLIPGVY